MDYFEENQKNPVEFPSIKIDFPFNVLKMD